jgi:alpha/beta superfamily hydrolase
MAPARSERVEFTGSQGTLAARLDLPEEEPLAFALFAHCFTCGKDLGGAPELARALARLGIAVLRFDFTGLGHSEGEFANTNFSSNVEDLVAAADHLRRAHRAPSLLVGHSLGGAAVLAAANRIPEARAIATLGAPSDPSHVKRLFADREPEIEREGEAVIALGGRRFRIRRQFLEDLSAHHLHDAIASLRRALLVMHAPLDRVVGIENASAIFLAAKHPKSFISLDDADHLLTRRADAEYAADVLVAWARRYLPTRAVPAEDREEPRDVVVGDSSEAGSPRTSGWVRIAW